MSQFQDFLKRMAERGQHLLAYWRKTPTTKIILINTGVYVPHLSIQCMWKLKVIPEEFLVKHFSC